MDTPRWLDERERRAWLGYLRMRQHLQTRIGQGLTRDSGLSEPDFEVLVELSEAPADRMRPFQLREALQWEQSRLSHQLRRMIKRGLVAREDCESDARGAYVALTRAGRAAIEAAAPLHVEDVRRLIIDVLTTEQLDALADISQTVLDNLAVIDAEEDAGAEDVEAGRVEVGDRSTRMLRKAG